MSKGVENNNKINEIIIRAAQDPIFYLDKNYEKGCAEAIRFLLQTRGNMKRDASLVVEGLDSDFREFYLESNSSQAYYDALTRLLQRSGRDQTEVTSAFMDVLPDSGSDLSRSEVVKKYLALCQQAVKNVYGEG